MVGWCVVRKSAMIHFVCRHCGRAFQVSDRAAGREERCPLCNGLVTVPTESQIPGRPNPASVPTAQGARPGRNSSNSPVPPPPTTAKPAREEEDLSARTCRSADETDIMPALQDESVYQEPEPLWKRHFRQLTEAHAKARNAKKRRNPLITAGAVALALLLVISLVIWALTATTL